MAKAKRRAKKRKKRKGKGKSSGSGGGGGGAMMSLRGGFKGLAGSLVGNQPKSKKGRMWVNIFWWVVTIVVGVIAFVMLYDRFSG